MRKFGVFSATIFLCILLAGIYGILHNQITYSISPEYFTEFKYDQFGFDPAEFGGHRPAVAVIGLLSTWFVGLTIGLLVGSVSLVAKDHVAMRRLVKSGIACVFTFAIMFGIIGFFRGKYLLVSKGVNWWIPETVVNKSDFIITGSIHNYSYLGGAIGILVAAVYIITKNSSLNKKHEATKHLAPHS